MVESPSSAFPDGTAIERTEWLPSLAGSRLLHVDGRVAPAGHPVLVLRSPAGEQRIEPRTDSRLVAGQAWRASFLISAPIVAAGWDQTALEWPHGLRLALPEPGAEVVAPTVLEGLRALRAATADASSTSGPGWSTVDEAMAAAAAPHPPEDQRVPAAPERSGEDRGAPAAPTSPEGRDALGVAAPEEREALRAPEAEGREAAAAPEPQGGAASAAAVPPNAAGGAVEPPRESANERVSAPPATWATPPQAAPPPSAEADAWAERRAALERELAGAAAALARAREHERSAYDAAAAALASVRADLGAARAAHAAVESALATTAAELDAERSSHAVTRASVARLRDEVAAGRERVAAAEQAAAQARREAEELRTALAAEREAREREARQQAAGAGTLAELSRHAAKQALAADAVAPPPEGETRQLLAGLDAAAASLRASHEPIDEAPPVPGVPAPPAAVSPAAETSPAPPPAAPPTGGDGALAPPSRSLRKAVAALASEDAAAAAAILAALLPAQGIALGDALAYDLTIAGQGSYGVTVANRAATTEPIERRRSRRQARFAIEGDAVTLAELLAGADFNVRRLSGRRRRRAKALRPLAASTGTLADATRAGARLDPALAFAVLPYAIDPAWTRGHGFTVAYEIVDGETPRRWYVTARDGAGVSVSDTRPDAPPDATVTMPRATFDALLRDEPAAAGAAPRVRGDAVAAATLAGWTDRIRKP